MMPTNAAICSWEVTALHVKNQEHKAKLFARSFTITTFWCYYLL